MTLPEVIQILVLHEQWIKSGGVNGQCANLQGLDLTLRELKFVPLGKREIVEFHLRGIILEKANLAHANLQGKKLMGANLKKANLSHSNLSFANFRGATLDYADLSRCIISHSDFRGASLEGANLSGAVIEKFPSWCSERVRKLYRSKPPHMGVNLDGAILTGANLSDANLAHSTFQGAILKNANLDGTDLRGTNLRWTGVIPQQLERAIIDNETKLPWKNSR